MQFKGIRTYYLLLEIKLTRSVRAFVCAHTFDNSVTNSCIHLGTLSECGQSYTGKGLSSSGARGLIGRAYFHRRVKLTPLSLHK